MSLARAECCSYGDAGRVCVSGSGQGPGHISNCGARRKMTSKNVKTEHIYFSDSNYFVWERVNTITLTTELGGFESLTGHCFPRERWGGLRIREGGPKNQVALFSLSSQKCGGVVTDHLIEFLIKVTADFPCLKWN